MTTLETVRLSLVALDLKHLRLLRHERSMMEQSMGLVPHTIQMSADMAHEFKQAIDFWLLNVESHPKQYAWYTNWEIILREENRSIGGIGLSGEPDSDGSVMVGYVIDARYHNRGFATESLATLINWSLPHPRLTAIKAETPKENIASGRVLEKNLFSIETETDQTYLWSRPTHPSH